MIKSANQYPVHALLSAEGNVMYRVPTYQREYSWQKGQWEDLFEDLVEADGAHFLGTIITLDQTTDQLAGGVLEVIDGQQRLTTLTLLLAAVHSTLQDHSDALDDDARTDLAILSRQLVRGSDKAPRLTPQTQGHNLTDYLAVLDDAGLPVTGSKAPYFPTRRMNKCFRYFKDAIAELAVERKTSVVQTATDIRKAAQSAILVKIEVVSHADAFVLFESLNNRGMPLTPVDLIKNHLLAESERRKIMAVDEAFASWNRILGHLGDSYVNQERFLRHYYNAFKGELPGIPRAPVATRANLIRIFEALFTDDLTARLDDLEAASRVYGRITRVIGDGEGRPGLSEALDRLMHAQGAPSYVLVMWAMVKHRALDLTESHITELVDLMTNFFVRRNLTGTPQTYSLPYLFMSIIEEASTVRGDDLLETVRRRVREVSVSDTDFRSRLSGPLYAENSDATRFILTRLAERQMTKETHVDLWAYDSGHYRWTIEHILPQGANLPSGWREMLGGSEEAAAAQEAHVHRLGNLTITAYNSTLGNKTFEEKRDRRDSQGRAIGYRNGLSLNADLATRAEWTVAAIEERTGRLVDEAATLFPL